MKPTKLQQKKEHHLGIPNSRVNATAIKLLISTIQPEIIYLRFHYTFCLSIVITLLLININIS